MATLLDYALTTVADVKESLSLASSYTAKDNLIIRKINQATAMIENYCGRRFKQTDYTNEEYDATGDRNIVLRQRPVTALTNFGSRDTSQNEDDWTDILGEDYFLDGSAGVLDLNFEAYGGWNRYRVSYTAGYATIPPDVAEAAAILAAFLVTSGTDTSNIKSKLEGSRKVEYFDNSGTSKSIIEQLGLDDVLQPYINNPLYAS